LQNRTSLAFGLIAAALATSALAAPARHAFGPDDLARIRHVGSPSLSPDGAWVAYEVRSADVAADKNATHIWMTSWDGSRHVQLTARDKESESLPRFSPDGTRIGFLSARDGSGEKAEESRLWLLDRAGGEARPVLGLKGSVEDYVWSPDGRQLALILFDPDPDASDAKDEDKKPKPIVVDRYHFKTDDEGYRGARHSRLWIYDFATGTARRLTSGDFDEGAPAWSPDGKAIAFVSNRSTDPDRGYDTNIYRVPTNGPAAEPQRLTSFAGTDNDPDFGSYPAWSPDGRSIAYLEGGPPELFSYGTRHLAVIPATGGERRLLTGNLDRNVFGPIWSADGRSITFTVEDDRAERIARVDVGSGRISDVAGGERVFSDLSGNGKRMAALLSTPMMPPEVVAIDGGNVRQLSHQNDAWLATVTLSPVTGTSFKSPDGTEVHGFVTLPANAAAKPLATILHNHGGPQAQFDWGFNPMWQGLAGHGYAVIASNPRGGTGRGQDYARAIYANWGGVDVKDALAAIDDAVARGIADPRRLGVGGWSYGGMLTNYLIASDQRFKAAVSGASIGNAWAGYGTDQYINDYETELGKPWENPEAWNRVSYPFLKNDRIITPTLFMVGQDDWNVPLINSEQMYQALRSRGIPTKLVIYPGEHHGIKRPSFLKDRMERWIGWYDQFIK
jgi:dipeptidyl aminopeptidase/acylaminoacyl peptidase